MRILMLAVVILAPALAAATFNVTTNADSGAGSLRQAIIDANAAAGPHTIQFTGAIGSNRTVSLQSALPDITEEVTVIGLASNDVIVRRGTTTVHFRIFTATGNLELRNLWVVNGSVQAAAGADAEGGAIHTAGDLTMESCVVSDAVAQGGSATTGDGGSARGGAIFCGGNLDLYDVAVVDSEAIGGDTSDGAGNGGNATGGGVFAAADVIMRRSSIQNCAARGGANSATPSSFGAAAGGALSADTSLLQDSMVDTCATEEDAAAGDGGQVALAGVSTIRRSSITGGSGAALVLADDTLIENSTISGNTGLSVGGIIATAGTVTLFYCTVHANAGTDVGGVQEAGATVDVEGTIIAGNTGTSPDADGTFNDNDDNLVGDDTGSTGFTTSQLVGTALNPLSAGLNALTQLGNTMGHVPAWGSFAQDRGSSNAPIDDQRGANRLFGGTPDIGAVESIDNQAPSFSGGGTVSVKPKGKEITIAGWASNISAGASWEQGQQLQFVLVGSRFAFEEGPVIDATTGDLTFTPHRDESGTFTFDVYLLDDGGGNDTSTPRLLIIHLESDDDDDEPDCAARSGSRGLPIALLLLFTAGFATCTRLKARNRVL